MFLHPLCSKILNAQHAEPGTYPLTLTGHVLELETSIADQDELAGLAKRLAVGGDYHHCLDHLPDGAPYTFVEIDMTSSVSPTIASRFEK